MKRAQMLWIRIIYFGKRSFINDAVANSGFSDPHTHWSEREKTVQSVYQQYIFLFSPNLTLQFLKNIPQICAGLLFLVVENFPCVIKMDQNKQIWQRDKELFDEQCSGNSRSLFLMQKVNILAKWVLG